MAIKEFTDKNGRIRHEIYVHKRDKNGKRYQRKATASTKMEAKRIEAQFLIELNQVLSGKPNMEWTAFQKVYLETALSRELKSFSTLTNELHNFSKHVDPKWQGKYLREITPSDISSIVHEGLKGKSQQTKKHLVCQIRSAFRLAIELGYADKDPTEHIRIKVEKFNRQLPTSSDLRRLVETAKELKLPMYPLMHFLLLTGCRSGEAFALDWSAVDLEGEVIHIRRNWTRRGGFKEFTKNKSHRQVPINEELKALLDYLMPLTSQTEERFVLPRIREWTNGEIGKSLRLFMQGLGMTPTTLHGLRAAFITEMLKSGADIPTVMRIVGHKTLETCTRYVSLSGVELRDKTQKLSFLKGDNQGDKKAA